MSENTEGAIKNGHSKETDHIGNNEHRGWRSSLSDPIMIGEHPRTISA